MGEITEPCGTPAFVKKDSDNIPSTTTLILRFVSKFSIHVCDVGVKPKAGSLARRFLCQAWLKAFEISRATARGSFRVSCSRCE